MSKMEIYQPENHIRMVTAASLFDGHDAAINIMRRILQSTGVEVIHLGHNRSVKEIVNCALQEDVQGIAVTSYQGGHIEFFTFMRKLLDENGGTQIKIFGGGGGVILPAEIEHLASNKIVRIFTPDDGRKLGLQGMINEVVRACDFKLEDNGLPSRQSIRKGETGTISRLITEAENDPEKVRQLLESIEMDCGNQQTPVIGITGPGGSGKSSLVDELLRLTLADFPSHRVAVVSVDPTRGKTGGALLGDRIRMNTLKDDRIYMRSMATRRANLALSEHISNTLCILKGAGFNLIFLETSGIGQSDTEIEEFSDVSLYVMTPEYGAATQLEKIGMLDYSEMVVINKSDKPGAEDALREVSKQYQRNHTLFHLDISEMPVYSTVASDFKDPETERLYHDLLGKIPKLPGGEVPGQGVDEIPGSQGSEKPVNYRRTEIIPKHRIRYLSEISEEIRTRNQRIEQQAEIATGLQALKLSIEIVRKNKDEAVIPQLEAQYKKQQGKLERKNQEILKKWPARKKRYQQETFTYEVRGQEVSVQTYSESMSHLRIPKITFPAFTGWGDILRWNLKENVPGEFPFTAGVFPFKREQEDPTRMFAGEGGPERTNRRFHYLSAGMKAIRLSTAFDSLTLYGADPDRWPDIYGKIGNSGVSIACLDDAKKLYSGFNLLDPATSVSMTINGPAPIMAGYFMNVAIDQQCELYIRKHGLEKELEAKLKSIYDRRGLARPAYQGKLPDTNNGFGLAMLGITGDQVLPEKVYRRIRASTIASVRGTVQSDILKEDQAQNTCIFSINFSLKLMGDVQEYFIKNGVRNFYSVSISGYHIAEAGANPITQLAYTLANGFTYVEYYLSRGMKIDEFAPNLSFFFSNGLDPEYTVIGRVARRIWSTAMKNRYGANRRSQKLKYHIQTSGRSLHAQEIAFNDIRTTLQAVRAIFDNCNSLHTNAYDEAITTPTEESVRRAMAIQLIINKELGLTRNQNPLQGSFIIEELTDLVEEAVLAEFDRLNDRGGVIGSMEKMYQRARIQEESLYYERMKNSGNLPLVGVNTFLSPGGSPTLIPKEVIRATKKEKDHQVSRLKRLHRAQAHESARHLENLKKSAIENQNVFAELMEVTKSCSLGQITNALYKVGGEYRRNM